MFLVIEGDNGSGKTTISGLMQKSGFHVVTDDSDVKELEKAGKKIPANTVERIESFIKYNEFCSEKSRKYEKSLLVRYWVSTMAAAYADLVFSKDEVLEKAKTLAKKLRTPDLVVYLQCDYSERISRIEKRKTVEGDLGDDISEGRNARYQEIISLLSKMIPNWKVIQVSKKTPEQVMVEIKEYLKDFE